MNNKSDYVIGIDIGSSSCKLGAFDLDGNLKYLSRKKIVLSREDTISNSTYPKLLWNLILDGLIDISHNCIGKILGIGLTGQIGTNFFINEKGETILSPVSWKSSIGKKEADEIWNKYGQSKMDDLLGVHVPASGSWPISRFCWLKENYPDFFKKGNKFIQPKDYIGFKLTGELATDILSYRGLVNPANNKINAIIENNIVGIDNLLSFIPKILTSEKSIIGLIKDDVAYKTGLSINTPIVVGCGDFHCSLLGSGVIDSTCGFNITGTSDHIGVLIPHNNQDIIDNRLGRYPSIEREFDIVYGATSAGGGSINWFFENFCTKEERDDLNKTVNKLIDSISNTRTPIYLPYLNGERAPIWNSKARGVFFGLNTENTKGDLLKSVLEGVAFSLYDNWNLLGKVNTPSKILVSGTAARDCIWNQLKADIFGVDFINLKCDETSCLGAAILAALGTNLLSDIKEAKKTMIKENHIFVSNGNLKKEYINSFHLYKELYKNLIPTFDLFSKERRNK